MPCGALDLLFSGPGYSATYRGPDSAKTGGTGGNELRLGRVCVCVFFGGCLCWGVSHVFELSVLDCKLLGQVLVVTEKFGRALAHVLRK